MQLKILHWNANGLQEDIDSAQIKQIMCDHNIDIMIINETKLIAKDKVKVQGFNCFRLDRDAQNRGGGVLILVNEKYQCNKKRFKTKNIESIGIQINRNNTIVSAYLPPQKLPDEAELIGISSASGQVIIIGDLNSRHHSWDYN